MSPEVKVLPNNPTLEGMARFVPNIIFSTMHGVELKMQLMHPWRVNDQRYPAIVFLQGSGWQSPDVNYQIPQLADYARHGYVVATITHRNFRNGHPAPAFLQDAKTAIRFLRKHADTFGIDPNRICFWGTSSGGNTALLVGMTGDDPRYKTEEYAEYSDSVQAVVECFGPTDLLRLSHTFDPENTFFNEFCGYNLAKKETILHDMSPYCIIEKGKAYPPMLLIHGDADKLVPYEQSEIMYNKLVEYGYDAQLICIKDAPHEHTFWSNAIHQEILAFIQQKL